MLTRHLLKLSEVEDQFRQLTNKFEEINFKLDKLSNRLSKIQADNQIRFQDIETAMSSGEITSQLSSKPKTDLKSEILPGSSQPQDLGTISYKDTETSETSQKIQSVDTTATVVTETFQAEEKILPQDLSPKKQYEFATSFLKLATIVQPKELLENLYSLIVNMSWLVVPSTGMLKHLELDNFIQMLHQLI